MRPIIVGLASVLSSISESPSTAVFVRDRTINATRAVGLSQPVINAQNIIVSVSAVPVASTKPVPSRRRGFVNANAKKSSPVYRVVVTSEPASRLRQSFFRIHRGGRQNIDLFR